MQHSPNRVAAVAAGVGTAVAAVTVAGLVGAWVRAARTLLESPFGPGWYQILVSVVATACVAGAWLSTATPGVPLGLALVVVGWLVPLWSAWTALPTSIRAALAGVLPVAVIGVALCVLGWRPRLTRWGRRLLAVVAAPALAAVVLRVLGYDPFADPHCRLLCADITPLLHGVLTTRETAVGVAILTAAAALACAVTVAVTGSAPAVVRIGALLALALSLYRTEPQPTTALGLVRATGVACLAGAVIAAGIRSWRARAAIQRLVATLGSPDTSPTASGARADAVHFAVGERWVDSRGVEVSTSDVSWLVLTDGDGPSIRLGLTRADDRDAVLAALTPATRLALTNARLAAVVRARMLDVQASQRRIVNASDRERRRIERDLHDGAQQQLVSIALHLSAVRGRLPEETAAELASAEDSVHEALAGLRRLAHGIFPAALGDEGLAAALEDAAAASDAVIQLDIDLDTEPDLGAAMAVYAAAALVLEAATPDTAVHLRISQEVARIHLNAVVEPVEAPPEEAYDAVRDRIGALGGTLSVQPLHGDGLEVKAVIPCESS